MNGSRSDRRLTPCLVSSVRHDMILVQIWRAIFQIFQQKFDCNCFVFSNLAPNVTPFCRPSTINLTVQHSLRRSSRHARHPSACGALARYRSSLQTLLADPPALHNISIKQNKNGPSATTFTEKPFHFFIENWPIYPLKRIKVNSIKFLFFFHFHVHFSFICFLTLCQGQVERYGREQRTLRPAAVDWRRHRSWRLRELCQARGKGQQSLLASLVGPEVGQLLVADSICTAADVKMSLATSWPSTRAQSLPSGSVLWQFNLFSSWPLSAQWIARQFWTCQFHPICMPICIMPSQQQNKFKKSQKFKKN